VKDTAYGYVSGATESARYTALSGADVVDSVGQQIKDTALDIGQATADKVDAVGNATKNTAQSAREKLE